MNRYGRRRADGIFEYSDSLEEIESSAIREDEEYLSEVLALVGFVIGAVAMYWLVGRHIPDWPKVLRFLSISAGACLTAFICGRTAVLLRQLFQVFFTVAVFGGLGLLVWRLLR
jgi:hypothetical protein